MDALQEAYLTLDILESSCEQQEQLQRRHLASTEGDVHPTISPVSIRDTEKEESNMTDKVLIKRVLSDIGMKNVSVADQRSSVHSIRAWRQK